MEKSVPPEPPRSAKPPSRRRHALRTTVLFLVLIGLLGYDVHGQLHAPLELPAPTTTELALGESLNHQLATLAQRGLFANLRQRWYLSVYARIQGRVYSQLLGRAAAIKAGEYPLEPGLTPLKLLTLLGSGKVVLHELRLIEGWRFAQAQAALDADANLQHSLAKADAAEIMTSLGAPGLAAEGQFFPDTYRFPKNTADLVILRQARTALEKILADEWALRAADLPYDSPQAALVMASIVEKETGVAAERAQIAGVFVRRLLFGMRLQTDPTVIYGLGAAYDGNLRSRDLVTDTPYNTYVRSGLPPTPICLAGRESIHAALHPDDGRALYFVARGDGTHEFSETLEAHNAAVRHFILHAP